MLRDFGGEIVATKSFLKSVNLHGKKQCEGFIKALESSQSAPRKNVVYSKTVSDMSREQIQKIFGDK